MSDLFLLSEDQMARISPYFPLSHGVARVDDRRVISGIIYDVIKHGLQWKDAPKDYGPHKFFTTASFVGAGLVYLIASLQNLQGKAQNLYAS